MSHEESREVRLRPVKRADLLAVAHIEDRTFDRPWTLSTFEQFLDAPAFLVLDDPETESVGRDIAGYVVGEVLEVRRNRIGHVKNIAVKPERQNQGWGSLLLRGALSILQGYGVDHVRLEVRPTNEPACSLYESAGFEVQARRENYYPDGEAALIMTRFVGD